MNSKFPVLVLSLTAVLVYGACNKQQDASKDAAQNAAQSAQQSANNAADEAQQAASNAADKTKDSAGRAMTATKNAASRAGEAMREAVSPTVIPAGTTLTIRLGETISAKTATAGQAFSGTLARPVTVDGKEAIASGARVSGEITEAQSAGKFKGAGVLAVRLTSVEVGGKSYNVSTSTVAQAMKGKGKRSLMVGGGGAALGAIIGGIAGGGKGAAIGALAGGGAGTAGAAYTGNKELMFPAETALSFKLKESVTLN
jgi:3D (Asp-Asp-Asp) domain-containing protein